MIATNPSTDARLAIVPETPPNEVENRVNRARTAGARWRDVPWPTRRDALRRWHRLLSRHADELAIAVCEEIGKPVGEAMAAEVVPSLDALRWTIRFAPHVLAGRTESPRWQRWLLMPSAQIERRALGVIGVIGAWNYPILLNVPVIAHALAAGNAVVWKPSELSSRCGELLQDMLDASRFPEGLISLIQGGPEIGAALLRAEVDKVVFTGGLENGRRVLSTLGDRGVPAVAELSGFDAAVVLPDAPEPATTEALRWSAFLGTGQACVSVKRIYLVGQPASPWAARFSTRVEELRVGDPMRSEIDLGPMISHQARAMFHERILAAVNAGARVITGAEPIAGPGSFYRPTVLLAEPGNLGPERALEGCFGPVVILREVPDDQEAIAAVNASRFGLSASVWSRDLRRARSLADGLEVGVVGVNESTTFFAHASLPFGGVKASGFGRVHGAEGLQEMTAPRATLMRSRLPAFRPHVFPYSDRLGKLLSLYRRLFH